MDASFLSLSCFCRQLCEILPVSISETSNDCKRLASTGVILHNIAVALENFARQHCARNSLILFESLDEGGLSYYCESISFFLVEVLQSLLSYKASGGKCCLSILDHLLTLARNEAVVDDECNRDDHLPADPFVRIASTFISQLLCHTAVVPACDTQLAKLLGGSSELPPISAAVHLDLVQNQGLGDANSRGIRWRLWKLQREAVHVLIKCTQSPIHPHVSSTLIFIISGALQVSVCESWHVSHASYYHGMIRCVANRDIVVLSLNRAGTLRRRGQTK
jgi:hypothetical protein